MKKMSMSEAGKLGYIASKNKLEKQKQERIEVYYKNPNRCKECNEVIEYKEKNKNFCNHSCSATFNNKNRIKKNSPLCSNCSKSLKKNASKFCSNRCQFDYQWMIKKEQISSSGKVDEIRQAKKYLKEVRGDKCEMCGVDTWAGKPILLLCDHINGNSSDWNLNNLRLICSNCDATTLYYKNKNKGNGRSYRRERYKLGKSF
jgi:endogenous inhibitor of DNA gyrase (YacG/DUF329 family)